MLPIAAVLREAAALWRRDHGLLSSVAGLFMFLPLMALGLLQPLPPELRATGPMTDAQSAAYLTQLTDWGAQAMPGWLLAFVVTRLGMLIVLLLYLDVGHPTLREALARALLLLPLFVLSVLLLWLPVTAGLFLFVIPGLYLLSRLSLVGAALAAGARQPGAAFLRSIALSRRHEIALLSLFAMPFVGQMVAAVLLGPLLALADSMGGVVAEIVAATLEAAIGAAALVAVALVQVAAYRRLAGSIRGI